MNFDDYLKLRPGKRSRIRFFFVGIGGTGMSSLACYLLETGFTIHGSDRAPRGYSDNISRLNQLGAVIVPQDGEGIKEFIQGSPSPADTFIIRTPAVEDTIPEAVRSAPATRACLRGARPGAGEGERAPPAPPVPELPPDPRGRSGAQPRYACGRWRRARRCPPASRRSRRRAPPPR